MTANVARGSRLRKMWKAAFAPPPSDPRPAHVDETLAVLVELRSRGFRPATILDVGAYDGRWSAMAAGPFPEARFFLIEPQVEMKGFLDAFCERHPGSRWLQAGAAATPGHRWLTIMGRHRSGSTFLPQPPADDAPRRQVAVVTIDALLEEGVLPVPDLVKLDVQGFELEVLRGGQRLFGGVEAFILETSLFRFIPGMPLFHEVVAFMAERGYLAYDFPGWLKRPLDGALGQMDVCFAREKGVLRAKGLWS